LLCKTSSEIDEITKKLRRSGVYNLLTNCQRIFFSRTYWSLLVLFLFHLQRSGAAVA